jgi:hypothetical protein
VWSHNNVRESDIYMLNMNIKNKSKLNQQIINKYKEIVL